MPQPIIRDVAEIPFALRMPALEARQRARLSASAPEPINFDVEEAARAATVALFGYDVGPVECTGFG